MTETIDQELDHEGNESEFVSAIESLNSADVLSRNGVFANRIEKFVARTAQVDMAVSYTHLTLPTIYSV